MSETEFELIFQRFSQAKPRTHTKYDGSGQGLYRSKMLTAKLGGDMSGQPIEGTGSTFTFYITTEVRLKDQHNLNNSILFAEKLSKNQAKGSPMCQKVKLELPLAVKLYGIHILNTSTAIDYNHNGMSLVVEG